MHDLSVPIMLKGRHWGGLRLGYKTGKPATMIATVTVSRNEPVQGPLLFARPRSHYHTATVR